MKKVHKFDSEASFKFKPENRNTMKKSITRVFMLMSLVAFYSCGSSDNNEQEQPEDEQQINDSTAIVEDESGIKLTPLTGSPEYVDAQLTVSSPSFDENALVFTDENGDEVAYKSEDLVIEFNVENYELGVQTEDAEGKGLANSGKGQHIHVILNNGPYSAAYEPKKEFKGDAALEDGNYVMLAFLSRSYHESVKAPGAAVLNTFSIGDEVGTSEFDAYGSHLFYSRPKGTYTGDDTKKVLLDFYLWKTEISEEGNYVEVTIGDFTQKLTEWTPYVIEGLPMGENTIKLELKDRDGNLIEGPYNSVERTITLQEEAPQE